MVQADGNKDKEKPKPKSEALGQISLDQAGALALRHARDNRGPYGRRYSAQNLAWEVLSQVESRDYYDIWLTYRPTTGFRGKPGIERFTIDKTGAIRLRSVLERPVRRRTLLAPGIVAGAIVIAGGLVGALFAAGLFPGESEAVLPSTATVSLVPETASQLVSPQAHISHMAEYPSE